MIYKQLSILMCLLLSTMQINAEENKLYQPQEIIQISTSVVIEHMKSAPKMQEARYLYTTRIIEKEVIPYMDFLAMTKLAVGKHWRRSSEEQQAKIFSEFKQLLIRTYVKVFSKYKNLQVKVLPFREGRRPDRAVVRTEVKKDNGGSNTIDYRFRLVNDKRWMVFDIKVEGVSLVTNYRTSFNAEITRNGVDGLIKLLVEKNKSQS